MAPSQHLRSKLGKPRAFNLALPAAIQTALVLGATLALSGCGAAQEAGAAAIVNGTVITDQDLQIVSEQLNTIIGDGQKLTPSNALLTLILAPSVRVEAERAGKTVSTSQARKLIPKVADPSPSTLEFIQMQLAFQQLDQASKDNIVTEIGKAKITVNPRYGTFDATAIQLKPITPNWLPTETPATAQ